MSCLAKMQVVLEISLAVDEDFVDQGDDGSDVEDPDEGEDP